MMVFCVSHVLVSLRLVFYSGAHDNFLKPPQVSLFVLKDWSCGFAALPAIHTSFAFRFVSPLVVHSLHFL